MHRIFFVFCGLLFSASSAFAHHEDWHEIGVVNTKAGILRIPLRIKETRIVIPTEECEEKGICGLKEVVFFEEDYELPPDPRIPYDITIRGTKLLAGIETATVDELTNYGFVQFIRGCMWNSSKQKDGTVTRWFGILREHLGARIYFIHPDWVVDTLDDDPVYASSVQDNNRHYFLQWVDTRPEWIPDYWGNFFGERSPTIPFAFVTDLPGPAVFSPRRKMKMFVPEEAKNMSLEFRMCVYHMKDIPKKTDGIALGFGAPIVCHDWKSSHVYDHGRGEFTSPPTIHPACSTPNKTDEKKAEELFRLSDKAEDNS